MKKEVDSKFSSKMALYGLAGLLVVIGSFFGGMQFQKSRGDDDSRRFTHDTLNLPGPRELGGSGFRRGAGISTVTAVSETSISVKSQRDNAETTYAITSDTKIIKDGATVTFSDIKVGDTVLVTAGSQSADDTSKTAERILLDPSVPERGM